MKSKKVKVMVKEKTSVFVNGKEIKFERGFQTTDPDIARILIEAGYAEEVEGKSEEEVKK